MEKIDLVIEKLHEIEVTLAKNTESLIIHEKRTDIAEKKLEVLNERIDDLKDRDNEQFKELSNLVKEEVQSINDKISPIKNHVEVLDKTFNIVWKIIIPVFIGFLGLLYKLGFITLIK